MLFMSASKFVETYFDDLDRFTLLLSCIGHDVDHRGYTNAFEMATLSNIAIRYNDESVLENHHVSTLFKILSKDQYNILANFSIEEFSKIRKFTINNILYTDMKKHFELIKSLEYKLTQLNEKNEPMIKDDNDKKLIAGFLVHSCDLSGSGRSFPIA